MNERNLSNQDGRELLNQSSSRSNEESYSDLKPVEPDDNQDKLNSVGDRI